MPELQEILKTIEEIRAKLNRIAEGKSLTDPEVVSVSQLLDGLLNEYQRMIKDKLDFS
jgi:uncharacterized protein YfkK (UPF0435 family)